MVDDTARAQVFAIVPAAGRSVRMGQPKQLLPIGGGTMLECVIEAVLHGDIGGLCVVTSTPIDQQLLLGEDPRFILAINDDAQSDMIDSIRIGIRALVERCEIADRDGYLVCPGDMPGVSRDDVAALTYEYRKRPGRIYVAACEGQRGHPVVFPVSMSAELETITDGGLRLLIDRHDNRTRIVERDSPGVVKDVNTPHDYERLREEP